MSVNTQAKTLKKTLDRNLWKWYCSNQVNGKKVSKSVLQARAKTTFHAAGLVTFKASDGWFRRFIDRWRHCDDILEIPETICLHSKTAETRDSSLNENILSTNETSNTESFTSMINLPHSPELTNINPPETCDEDHIVNFNTDNVSVINDGLANLGALSDSMLDVNTSTGSFANVRTIVPSKRINDKVPTNISIETASLSIGDHFSSDFTIDSVIDKNVANNFTMPDSIPCSNLNESTFELLNGCLEPQGAESNGTNVISEINGEYAEEIIDCLSKFIDTSELSETSMDFFYDSDDSSFSTTRNALLLAETENQTSYEAIRKCKEMQKNATSKTGLKHHHRKRGERYLPHFKEKVLSYVANRHTIQHAAKKFNIDQMTIAQWRQEKLTSKLLGRLSADRDGKGSVGERTAVDEQFVTWLRRCRERGVDLSSDDVRRKVKMLQEQAAVGSTNKWFMMWTSRVMNVRTSGEGRGSV